MKLSDFDFILPEGRIAQRPAEPRDSARLLYVPRDAPLQDLRMRDIPSLLRPGDVLVVNNSKVIPARLHAMRGKAQVEILLHRRQSATQWEAFLRPQKRMRVDDKLDVAPGFRFVVKAHYEGGLSLITYEGNEAEFMSLLLKHGLMPLPPYIKRDKKGDEADRESYQTIYAAQEGSVAAPTAGLHFTPSLMEAIRNKGVETAFVTLHVGAGTFQPVKAENIAEHVMHAEYAEIGSEAACLINAARAAGGRVIAVGTTATRTLESAATPEGLVNAWQGDTRLFITPGYRFKVVDGLLTNFHLPKSTLFMLVSAFAGMEEARDAYAHALAGSYRFFSYGDACFFEKK